MTRLDKLEAAYEHSGDKDNALKIGDESDKVAEQTDIETHAARQFISSLAGKSLQKEISVATVTEDQSSTAPTEEHTTASKQTLSSENNGVHPEMSNQLQQQALQANNSIGQEQTVEVPTSGQEQPASVIVDDTEVAQLEPSNIPSGETITTSGGIGSQEGTRGHLERIRIPTFAGDKMKYQQWNAAFTSCIERTSLAPQFKMLRLEACLRREAADTVKGLGYSEEAYNAAWADWKGNTEVVEDKFRVI